MKKEYDIFVSYRRYDEKGNISGRDQARLISKELQLAGYQTFFDYSEIKDDEFDKIIIPAVENCRVFILVLSKDALNRCNDEQDWVRREIETAIQSGCKIITISPDNAFNGWPNALPASLSRIKTIQISDIHFGSLFEESIKKMINERISPFFKNTGTIVHTSLLDSQSNNCELEDQEDELSSKEDYIVDLGDVRLKMIKITGGTFELWSKDMLPVNVSDFWIGETTVTVDFYDEVMGLGISDHTKENKLPKSFGLYNEYVKFIKQLNIITDGIRPNGTKFRLPTEIEWEYAARGGHKQRPYIYSGSNKADEVAWFCKDPFGEFDLSVVRGPHPVGKKKPNSIGLYDMSGNIDELCVGYEDIDFYLEGTNTNFNEHLLDSILVLKGGSWVGVKHNCLINKKGLQLWAARGYDIGLRVVLSKICPDCF